MPFFDYFFEQILEADIKFCGALLEPFLQVRQELLDYLDQENENEERCTKNGQEYVPNWGKYVELTQRYEQTMELPAKAVDQVELNFKSNNKENISVTSDIMTETSVPSINTTTVRSSRPKRAAFLDASKTINKQVNMKLSEKLRREDVASEAINNTATVKAEKLSTISRSDDVTMPPPQSFPIKLRPNRRIKKERLQISDIIEGEEIVDDVVEIKKEHSKNSDVILQEPRISLVDLTLCESSQNSCTIDKTRDDESSNREACVVQDTTSDKQSTDKRNCSDDNVKSSNKRSKLNTQPINEDSDDSGRSHYDDAISTIDHNENVNATFVTESTVTKSNSKVNTTIILHKEPVDIPDSLLTDDESDQEAIKSYTKPVKITKQVFSAFEQSPVKKKVEAFEKLGASANVPIRITRTKTRALEKQLQLTSKQQSSTKPVETMPTNNVKEKAKFFSPTRIHSQQPIIKTKLDDMREKEIVKANEKRQARLQQLTEAKRRKREEKELKAQQQRVALEREKLKQLHEQEKLKDERHKKLLLEQEQKKKQKLLQEAEQKRLLAKQKAMKAKQQQKPIYLTMETPLLPTNDCYDSDEEDYHKIKTKLANWAQGRDLECGQFTMIYCGEKIKNTFFSRRAQTVDLQDLFQTKNPRLLKRTSSAHWTIPPKYSILPTRFETTLETSNDIFEEEEED